MSIQDRAPSIKKFPIPLQHSAHSERSADATIRTGDTALARTLATLRILMGLTFLWAFLDKVFGLGYSTGSARAWVNGGSPTEGFLGHVQVGPAQSLLRDMAGSGFVDWLFMLGLLGIGLALLLGIGMRLAAAAGSVLLAAMWIAEWPLAQSTSAGTATSSTNPLIDYHLVYLVVLIALALYAAGDTWGLGRQWAKVKLVGRNHWLR
jgi:thiosulfate dehydrogenase (quinone) large subunit